MTSPLNKRKPGRRGRPKKNYNEIKTTPFLPEKPREERSYEDFFPDLNVKEPLPVIKIHTSTLNEVPMTTDRKTIEKESLPVPSYIRIAQENKLVKSDSVCYQHTRADNEYIRYIEPSESELFDTVEYDMDEQDQTWLKILNNQRKKEGLGEISGDVFEKVIDQLEKEWFNLIKSVPKKYECQLNSLDDAKCAVCDDGECENSNAIVFCDGCNLAVHQDCYGIPYIPEGQWLCRKCMVSPEHPVSCIFCPREGGAFKQTTTNQWGHLICAIWIPEVNLSNSVYMEPIDNIENIPKNRWKLTCSICRQRHGACIQCDHKHCFVAFHVTCARWARLCMRMKLHGTQHDGANLKAYCDRHTPRDYKEQVDVDKWMTAAQQWFMDPTRKKKKHMIPLTRYINEELETREKGEHIPQKRKTGTGGHNVKRQKRHQYLFQLIPPLKEARAHQHHFSADVPIAPDYILHKLESMVNSCQNEKIRKKALLITNISRYWSLKRGARRGTPLLKRLHLEPWTASSSQLKQTEVEKAHKAAAMINLRADLEKLRMLSEQVQKREKQKLDVMRKQKAYLEIILYPVEYIARSALNSLIELDKKGLFMDPVTSDMAPDYTDIIKNPMSFSDIMDNLESHKYTTLDEFEKDITFIWENSLIYNKPDTVYYKLAQRLKSASGGLMEKARNDYATLAMDKSGLLDVDIDTDIFTYGNATDDSENAVIELDPSHSGEMNMARAVMESSQPNQSMSTGNTRDVAENSQGNLQSGLLKATVDHSMMTKSGMKMSKPFISHKDENKNKLNSIEREKAIRVQLFTNNNSSENSFSGRQKNNNKHTQDTAESMKAKRTLTRTLPTRQTRSRDKKGLPKTEQLPEDSFSDNSAVPPLVHSDHFAVESGFTSVTPDSLSQEKDSISVSTQQSKESGKDETGVNIAITQENGLIPAISEVSEVSELTKTVVSETGLTEPYIKVAETINKENVSVADTKVLPTRKTRNGSKKAKEIPKSSEPSPAKDPLRKTVAEESVSVDKKGLDNVNGDLAISTSELEGKVIVPEVDMPERKTRSRTSKTQEVKSNVSVDNPVTNCIKHSIKEQKKAATSKTDDNRATALIEEKTHSTKKAENDKVEKEVSPGTTKVFIKTTRNLKHQTPATNEVKEVPNVESKITTRKTRGKKLNQGNPSAEAINKPVQVETLVIALTEQIAETTSTPITKNNTQKEDSTIEKSAVNVAAEENSQPAPLTRLTRNNLHPVEKTTTRNALNTRASRTKSVVDPVEASLPTPTISTASSSIADPAETSPPTTRRSPRNNSVVDPAETSPPTTRQSPRNNTVVDPAETSSSTTRRSARNNLVVDSEESSSPTRRRSLRSTVKADEFSNVTNKYPLRKDKKSRVIKKIPNGKDKKSPTEDTSNMSNKAVSNRSTGNKRKSAEVADTAPTKKLRSERVRVSYTDGEIVWAYVPCFPAHPSRIVKKMTDRVPDWVKEAKPAGDKVLVEFFLVSENHTWSWVNKSDIYPFGDPENDIVMLKKAKKCPKRARMREVRKAYIHVCELKKIDPTPQLEKGFS